MANKTVSERLAEMRENASTGNTYKKAALTDADVAASRMTALRKRVSAIREEKATARPVQTGKYQRQQMEEELAQLRKSYTPGGAFGGRTQEDKDTLRRIQYLENQLRRDESEAYYEGVLKRMGELDQETIGYLDQLREGMPETPENMQGIADNRSWEEIYAEQEAWDDTVRRMLREKGYDDSQITQMADDRTRQVNRETFEREVAASQEEAEEQPFWASVKSVPQNLTGGLGTLSLAGQNAHKALTGDDRPVDYYTPEMVGQAKAQAARQTVSQNLEENTEFSTKLTGNVAAFIYNTGMSMTDSAAVAGMTMLGVPPAVGTTLLGGSAATQAAREAKERGVSDAQALFTGLAAGAAESFFEKYSLGNLLEMKPARGVLTERVLGNLKNIGIQAGVEGSEELATSLANAMTDAIINGDKNAYTQSVYDYMAQGMTYEDATKAATGEFVRALAQDFLGGALSGGTMGGFRSGTQTALETRAIGQQLKGTEQTLIDERRAQKAGDQAAQRMQEKMGDKFYITDSQRRELFERTLRQQNREVETTQAEAAAARLRELGEDGDVEKIAQAAVKSAAGNENGAQRVLRGERALRESTYGAQVAQELREGADWTQGLPKAITRSAELERVQEKAINPAATDEREVVGTQYNPKTKQMDARVKGEDGEVETVPMASARVTMQTLMLADVAAVYGEAGPTMMAAIRPEQSPTTYARQWNTAYEYALGGMTEQQVMKSRVLGDLTEEQKRLAWQAGNEAAKKKTAQNAKERAERAKPKEKKAGTVSLKGATIDGVRYAGVDKRGLTQKQRDSISVMRVLAQETGVNVVFYESLATERGRIGANGVYQDGTIYLDIAAGVDSLDMAQVAVLRTAAHELTHYIQDMDEEAYNKVKDFVLAKLSEREGVSLETLIQNQIGRSRGELSHDEAIDEVVADACEMMLKDSAVLEELARQDQTLAEKIVEFLKKLMQRLQKAFEGVEARSAEAKAMAEYTQELQQIWDEALRSAIDGGATKNTAETGGVAQYSIREAFASEVDAWDKDGRIDEERFVLGSTGPVLRGLGAIESDIYMNAGKINAILRDHPEMTLDEIKRIPQMLEDPVLVLKSKGKNQRGTNSRVVIFGSLRTTDGRPVLAVMDLRPTENGFTLDDMQKVNSAYAKKNPAEFIRQSEVLYADKKRTIPLLRQTGLTITSQQLLQNGYIGSITYRGKEVNLSGEPFSAVVSEKKGKKSARDSEYAAAVENGDVETAQRMVDEAARAAGYTIKAYHGTNAEFFTFDKGRVGKGQDVYGSGFYFAGDREASEAYGKRIIPARLKLENPYRITVKPSGGGLRDIKLTQKQVYEILKRHPKIRAEDSPLGDFYEEFWEQGAKDWMIRGLARQYTELQTLEGDLFRDYPNELHEAIRDVTGHDGIEVRFQMDESGFMPEDDWFYVAWFDNQMKSAEPVVRDDAGEVIPLSQRFDKSQSDIRYSLRDTEITDREILAATLDSAAQNEGERSTLEVYRGYAIGLEELEKKLAIQRQKIQDHERPAGDPQRIELSPMVLTQVRNRAAYYAREIDKKQKYLKVLERQKALQDVLARERAYIEEQLNGDMEAHKARYAPSLERKLAQEWSKAQYWRKQYEAAVGRNPGGMKMSKRAQKAKLRKNIEQSAKRLMDLLVTNTDKKHVPEDLKEPLGEFLTALDLSSTRLLSGRPATKKDADYAAKLTRLKEVLDGRVSAATNGGTISGYLDLPTGFAERLQDHIDEARKAMEQLGEGETVVNRLSLEQLEELNMILNVLKRSIETVNELMANRRFADVEKAAVADMAHLREIGKGGGDAATATGKAEGFLSWTNLLPVYAFRKLGKGAQSIFESMQDGWDKLARNAKMVMEFTEKTYTPEEAKAWSEEIHEVELYDPDVGEYTTVYLTTAQIMSLWALSQRQQAYSHIVGDPDHMGMGIRPEDIVLPKTLKRPAGKTIRQDTHFRVGERELQSIVNRLTARQLEVAKALQKFMEQQGSAWGNEVSMQRHGYNFFGEKNYFPIETDREDRPARNTEQGSETDMYRLLNLSSTKALTRGARNAVIVRNMFDVYSNHMADMAKYNALALPLLDAIKWYNWSQNPAGVGSAVEGAGDTTLKRAITKAYGKAANEYIVQFIRDMNGVKEGGGRGEDLPKRMISNYKRASVAANLRVAFLQPTSYVRAGAVIEPKYLLSAAKEKTGVGDAAKEMREHSGIALWKSMGFFDTDVGRSMREQIKGTQSKLDKWIDKSMILAEKGDEITWAMLWKACKAEQSDKGMKGEELMKATAERFREVVYTTQVVDSTMTRSGLMRGTSTFNKMATSFMSEPTVSYNMVMQAVDAVREDMRKGKGMNARMAIKKNTRLIQVAVTTYAGTAIFSALMESLFDALRDDDDDKFVDKLLQAFGENAVSNLNPLDNLPFVKDIVSIIQGYSSDRMDTAGVVTLVNAFRQWNEHFRVQLGLQENYTKVTSYGNQTNYGRIYQTAKGLSQLFGIPVSNALREVQTVWNNLMQSAGWDGLKWKTYENVDETSARNMYEAMQADDKTAWAKERDKWQKRLMKEGTPEREALSTVRSGVKAMLKEDYYDGSMETAEAEKFLTAWLGMQADDAKALRLEWDCYVETGIKFGDIRSLYETDQIARAEVLRLRMKYGQETRNEAEEKAKWYDWGKEYPGYADLSEKKAGGWYDYVARSGLSAERYYQIAMDAEEQGANSKAKLVAFIRKQGLPASQQRALWYALKNSSWKNDGTPWA